MREIFVSVIVIGYNIEDYIVNCLDSIIGQDYKNYEIIYVDDGSVDTTVQCIKENYEETQIKVIQKENGGIISARKIGVEAAQGEFIVFVDGDDWINQDMLTNLVKELSDSITIDIVCSHNYRQNEVGEFIIHKNNVEAGIYDGFGFFENILSETISHHMFPKLYRKQFILDAGYLNYSNITIAEDLLTNALFGMHTPVVCYSDTVNYYYRYNCNSVIRSGDRRLLEQIRALEIMEEQFTIFLPKEKFCSLMEFQWSYFVLIYVADVADVKIAKRLKLQIVRLCRQKAKNYKENGYFINRINNLLRWQRWLFYGYWYCPILMFVGEPCIKFIAHIKGYLFNNKGSKQKGI